MADEEPFYSAYGKISSRFGVEDGAQLADELTAADIGPDGPASATAKVKTAPTESHKLMLFVEQCTATRPSESLKGSTARYEEAVSNLEAAFSARFSDGQWRPEQLDFVANPPAERAPYCYLPADKAAEYKGRLGSLASPTYLHEMGMWAPKALREGRMVIDASAYPPQLVKYPRIGAFEVTYQLLDQGKPIAQKLVYSKIALSKFPNNEALIKKVEQRVQLDLYKQRLNFASHAKRSKELAEKQRALIEQADEAARREAEEAAAAQAQLAEAEVELQAARDSADDAAIAQLERALEEMRARVEKEQLEAREAARALAAAVAEQSETIARAEIAEARLAMQEARKELTEWEMAQQELESALESAESLIRKGDSTGAAAMRQHASRLREASDRELADVRAANDAATQELLEAVEALLRAAEAKYAACEDDGADDEAAATGDAHTREVAAERRNALKAVAEAKVQIEDAQAQAAMVTADLEFKEAVSFMLQAKLAASEAKHATEGDVAAARTKAVEMRKRALEEMADARNTLEKAAIEAVEAAEARLAKELAEAEQTQQELTRAETASEAARASRSTSLDELTASVDHLRKLVEREGKDLVAAKLNVDMTRSELQNKQAAIEKSLEEASAEAAEEEAAMEMQELTSALAKELLEAEEAEARAGRLTAEARLAQEEAAAASLKADDLVRAHGKRSAVSKAALEAEVEAIDKAKRLRLAADEAEFVAQRERQEAQIAEVHKEEVEAQRAYERYVNISEQADGVRRRLEAALQHVESAAASGEIDLEERAAEAASNLQTDLDKLTEDSGQELEAAQREQEEASAMHEKIETDQARAAERLLAKAMNAVEDAEADAERANRDLTQAKGAAVPKTSELKRLREIVEQKDTILEDARSRAADARTRLDTEREEAASAAVTRAQKVAEFAMLRNEFCVDLVQTLELRLDAAQSKAAVAEKVSHFQQQRFFEAQAIEFKARLFEAKTNAKQAAERATATEAGVAAALRQKERQEALEADIEALRAEAAADRAEVEAERAAAAFKALATSGSKRGGGGNNKRMAETEALKEQSEAKARRLRGEAVRLRAQAEKEKAELDALDAP